MLTGSALPLTAEMIIEQVIHLWLTLLALNSTPIFIMMMIMTSVGMEFGMRR